MENFTRTYKEKDTDVLTMVDLKKYYWQIFDYI